MWKILTLAKEVVVGEDCERCVPLAAHVGPPPVPGGVQLARQTHLVAVGPEVGHIAARVHFPGSACHVGEQCRVVGLKPHHAVRDGPSRAADREVDVCGERPECDGVRVHIQAAVLQEQRGAGDVRHVHLGVGGHAHGGGVEDTVERRVAGQRVHVELQHACVVVVGEDGGKGGVQEVLPDHRGVEEDETPGRVPRRALHPHTGTSGAAPPRSPPCGSCGCIRSSRLWRWWTSCQGVLTGGCSTAGRNLPLIPSVRGTFLRVDRHFVST